MITKSYAFAAAARLAALMLDTVRTGEYLASGSRSAKAEVEGAGCGNDENAV